MIARARVCGVLLVLAAALPTHAVPSFDEVRAALSFDDVRASHVPSDVPLLARDGQVLHLVRIDPTVRRGAWLALSDISSALRTAIVLGEDRRFHEHAGIDWRALAASAWANAWNTRTRGASTLTMQLAALTDEQLARPAGGRTVLGKFTQMQRASAFEATWSKAQILEAYLNRVPLRGEVVGVDAAAWTLFGKHASGLDTVEAALLAALVRAPNAAPVMVERRACEVLRLQQQSCTPLAATLARALERKPGPLRAVADQALAPHYAQQLARTALRTAGRAGSSGPPRELRSTLDAPTQRVAVVALRRQLSELRGRNVEDGAVLVLDRASGEVLAWVGSSGPLSGGAAQVDAVLARRQAGSTLKPFVYGLALQQRLLTAASLLDDSPLQLDAGGALYAPQNYDGGYKGAVSVRQALASSLNVPAVRVATMVGPDAMFATLNDAGLALRESAGWHGHALALGSAEITLAGLTEAYRALANGRLFGPQVSWLVADMLADPAARGITFGLDSPLVTRGWAAVKTGTSKDMRDNWCIGFSDRFVVGVWVGNASGAPMHGVSGTSGAAPVWRELMAHLHVALPSKAPAAPSGLRPVQHEWFLAGTEPVASTSVSTPAAPATFGIASPRSGSILALDPDIPRAAQALVFRGEPGRWSIDGAPLGHGTQVRWLPRPGRHVLEWRGAPGTLPDRVEFEVRSGAPLQRPSLRPSARAPATPNPAKPPTAG
jgi:penicillin-binding protein 1C